MRFLTFAGIMLFTGPLMASSISYVTADSNIFSGGVDNNYDSVNGLSQHIGTCYAEGSTNTVPCATVTSTPSSNAPGLTSASVAITNGQSYDPQNGVTGYANASAYANLLRVWSECPRPASRELLPPPLFGSRRGSCRDPKMR